MANKIIGVLLILPFAILFFKASKPRKRIDYSQYPTIEADVQGTEDGHWIVEFVDNNGERVLGRDDEVTLGKFNPPEIRVRKGAREMVYYWPWNRPNHRFSINGVPLKYNIHFCNPIYDEQNQEDNRKSSCRLKIIGWIMVTLAIVVFIFV